MREARAWGWWWPHPAGTTKSLGYQEGCSGGRAFEVDGAAAHENELVVDGVDGGLEGFHAVAPFDLDLAGEGAVATMVRRGVPEDVAGGEVLDPCLGEAGGAKGGDDGAEVIRSDAGGSGDGFESEGFF